MTQPDPWVDATRSTIASWRRTIDAAVAQLSDEELRRSPAPGVNSVAVILRHMGGNLRSRWTDFRETDGEKPDRDRDREFEDWPGDRASLLAHFDAGWRCLVAAVDSIGPDDLHRIILIRGERCTVPVAVQRSITHVSYHAGQILMVARTVHAGPWGWITIPPGQSQQHNAATWGTPASRGVAGTP
ncbi:MAG: DUF1572 family protein [Phycisphaerales bacterium]